MSVCTLLIRCVRLFALDCQLLFVEWRLPDHSLPIQA